MTTYLLDVNVLIALVDTAHVQHEAAHTWFEKTGQHAWASCPLTENGLIRIVGHPRYPSSPGTPAAVNQLLAALCALPGHAFWPDDISCTDANHFNANRLLASSQVTDSYLLALAIAHGGQLATLDSKLVTSAVRGGEAGIHFI